MNTNKKESGMVIIEATIVFPVMFIVIFAMIFLGNLYVQKCRVNYVVSNSMIKGINYCSDPLLDDVMNGNINVKNMDILPYRYVLADKGSIEGKLENEIRNGIAKIGDGFIFDMKPNVQNVDIKFNNAVIYSTLSANVDYKIELPIKMIGENKRFGANLSVNMEMPISDTTEFMRNLDLVEDYMQRSKTVAKLQEALSKAIEWFK